MDNFFEKSPLEVVENEEFNRILLNFCSLICILKNKKMNYPSIFVTVMETPEYFEAYKRICGFEDSREAVKEFLNFDESIVKSKFIKKIINGNL